MHYEKLTEETAKAKILDVLKEQPEQILFIAIFPGEEVRHTRAVIMGDTIDFAASLAIYARERPQIAEILERAVFALHHYKSNT